jgi:hypothetical protein
MLYGYFYLSHAYYMPLSSYPFKNARWRVICPNFARNYARDAEYD